MAAQRFLLQLIQTLVVGQYYMSAVRNYQIAAINTLFLHAGDFSQHNAGVDNYAIAQNIDFILEENTGGQKTQLVANVVNHNSVASIGAAAIAHYSISLLCQVVNNFTFTFVAPLSA